VAEIGKLHHLPAGTTLPKYNGGEDMSKVGPIFSRRAAIVTPSAWMLMAFMSSATSAQDNGVGNSMVVEGVLAYLGVLPAAVVRGHPESHAEGSMHGGVPEGQHQYHIVLALFDAASGKRIESAQVSVSIMGLGHVGGNSLNLDPMTIANSVTWGTFVKLPGADLYDLKFKVLLPARKTAISFSFRYSHSRN
jgi:hypothetical protein